MSVRRRLTTKNDIPPTHSNAPAISDKNHVINLVSTSGGLPEVAYYDLKLYSDDYPSWTMFFYSDVTTDYSDDNFFMQLRYLGSSDWRQQQGVYTQSYSPTDADYATISLKFLFDQNHRYTIRDTSINNNTWHKPDHATLYNRAYAVKRENNKLYWSSDGINWTLFPYNGFPATNKNNIYLVVGGNKIASDGKCEFQLWLDTDIDLNSYFAKY